MISSARKKDHRSVQEVAERLQWFETKNQLWQYEIDGWCAWAVIRFRVSFALIDLPRDPSPMGSISQLLNWPFIALRDFPTLLFPPRSKYFIRTVSTAHSELVNGKYKDVDFDDLISNLGSCIKVERLINKTFDQRRRKALIKSDLTTALLDMLAYGLSLIGSTGHINNLSRIFSKTIINDLGLGKFTPRIVLRWFMHFYWHKRLYAWLLRKIKPNYVIFTNTGEYALISAANELGIKTIEYQHGIFNRYDDYAFNKSALPYKKKMLVPDRTFLYGDYWKQELEAGGYYKDELLTVGNIRVDQHRQERDNRIKSQIDNICHLLLTTQGIDTENLIDFITKFLMLAEGKFDYQLNIKLHLVHEKSKSRYIESFGGNKRVNIYLGFEEPSTMALLTKSDFHLSIASACHYDALGVGVTTVILGLTDYETVFSLYQAGHAFLARMPEDLVDIIINNMNKTTISQQVREWYCAPNALKNFINGLDF